jgi:hypothetical protein
MYINVIYAYVEHFALISMVWKLGVWFHLCLDLCTCTIDRISLSCLCPLFIYLFPLPLVGPLTPTHCRCRRWLFNLTTHTHTHTLGRSPVDKGSTHNIYKRQDSNPRSQQAICCRPKLWTEQLQVSALVFLLPSTVSINF